MWSAQSLSLYAMFRPKVMGVSFGSLSSAVKYPGPMIIESAAMAPWACEFLFADHRSSVLLWFHTM